VRRIGLIAVAAVAGSIAAPPATAQLPGRAPAQPAIEARAEVRVPNACPFEGCTLGRWTARQPVRLFQSVNGLLQGTLPKGARVTALEAEIRAVPRRAIVTKVWDSDRAAGLRVGSMVDVLHPGGEGTIVLLHRGRIVQGSLDLMVRYNRPLQAAPLRWTWWVRVQRDDGRTAWTKNPQGLFSGMDKFASTDSRPGSRPGKSPFEGREGDQI